MPKETISEIDNQKSLIGDLGFQNSNHFKNSFEPIFLKMSNIIATNLSRKK